ncbi:MAG: AI-2E family transporter [Propionibacterium sp.]|nr:AI-2E family transporter [Propionibacterium sp.]
MAEQERWQIPSWVRLIGLTSWYGIGVAIAIAIGAWFVSATRTIIIPFVLAVLLAAMLSPVADRLEKRGVKRWIGALLCTLLVVLVGAGLVLLIVVQVINQAPQIGDQVGKAISDVAGWLDEQGWGGDLVTSLENSVKENWRSIVKGVAPRVSHGLSSLATWALVIVLAVNILFFLIKDGQQIFRWASGHLGMPREIGANTLVYSARSIRGYFVGTTVVGVVNALVVSVGALVLGTPLAFVLGVVTLFTNYIPFIGALVGGAFAVLIAFAGGGFTDALVMLILVLAANGPAQWIVQPLALGASLNLHPIVVLFTTMAGAILAGPIGGVVAAPLAAVAVEAVRQISAAGLFDERPGDEAGEPPPRDEAGEPPAALESGAP